MRFDLTVNEFTRECRAGSKLVVFGEQFWRPYIHVRDAAEQLRSCSTRRAKRSQARYSTSGNSARTTASSDLVEILKDRFSGATVSYVRKDEDPRDYRVSFEKMKARLGFDPHANRRRRDR